MKLMKENLKLSLVFSVVFRISPFLESNQGLQPRILILVLIYRDLFNIN